MSTALQSPGGVFVQSLGGFRDTGRLLVIGDATLGRALSNLCDFQAFSGNDCEGPFNSPAYNDIVRVNFNHLDQYTISDITQSDPAVVTMSVAHDLTDSMLCRINNVTGMTEINGENKPLRVVDPFTIELIGEDSTGYSAYTGGGVVRVQPQTGFFFGNARFTGVDSGSTVTIYTNCEDLSVVNDADGIPIPTPVISEGIAPGGQISIYHGNQPVNCVGSLVPQFIQDESVVIELIEKPPIFVPVPNESSPWFPAYEKTGITVTWGNGLLRTVAMLEPAGAVATLDVTRRFVTVNHTFQFTDVGQTFTFTLEGTNKAGSGQVSWDVTVTN